MIREFASCSFVVILVYHKREIGNFYICSFTYIYISTKLKLVTKRVLTSTDMNKKSKFEHVPKPKHQDVSNHQCLHAYVSV